MLGLNFHIFWMKFAIHLDIKLFSEKTEKDFQWQVIKKPAPRNILLEAGDPPSALAKEFLGAGDTTTHP